MSPLWLWALFACGEPSGAPAAVAVAPVSLAAATCEACGMVVHEQPAPRGQVHHGDGHTAHLCSLGDLRAHVQNPNAHGRVAATFVERLPADVDLGAPLTAELPWIPAEEAWFVVGVPRPGTMGRPALSFGSETDARAAAERLGGRVVRWSDLLETPFSQDPPARSTP